VRPAVPGVQSHGAPEAMSRPFAETKQCKCCQSPVCYPRPWGPCIRCWDAGCRQNRATGEWKRAEGCKWLERVEANKHSNARTVAVRRLERV